MRYKIAIVDDEDIIREEIEKEVRLWAQSRKLSLDLETFPSGDSFLFHWPNMKNLDLLLLDIEMEGLNGVKLSKILREEKSPLQIVFITGFMDYIEMGYDVDALHYLLKPIDSLKFQKVLDKAYARRESDKDYLSFETKDEFVRLSMDQILYLEVDGNYLTIHTSDRDYQIKSSLKQMEDQVDARFFKIYRSILVNIKYIRSSKKDRLILKNGLELPLARGKYRELNQYIIDYF